MESKGEGLEAGRQHSHLPGDEAHTGRSGEGSRSALEQWIRQERDRRAQRPRDGGGPVTGPAP